MPVCIAGMHRSGTSLVSRLLQDSGLYLGPASDLIPAKPANPEGFWENRRFVRLNQKMLRALGGTWDNPPAVPASWLSDRILAYRSEAVALVREFEGREPWGWKDPRNCLTLPVWQALLGRFPVVIVVRNPLEVAQSLHMRNGFPLERGLGLWHDYNQRLLDVVEPTDRIVTHFNRYFRDPSAELVRMVTWLGLRADNAVAECRGEARVSGLRHHRLTGRDLAGSGATSALCAVYRDLCAE